MVNKNNKQLITATSLYLLCKKYRDKAQDLRL